MVALFKSYIMPIVVLSAVPLCVIGVVIMLYFTGNANQRAIAAGRHLHGRHRGVQYRAADRLCAEIASARKVLIRRKPFVRAASIRVRPVIMTAWAAFFALIPMAMAFQRGSEANAPLGERSWAVCWQGW